MWVLKPEYLSSNPGSTIAVCLGQDTKTLSASPWEIKIVPTPRAVLRRVNYSLFVKYLVCLEQSKRVGSYYFPFYTFILPYILKIRPLGVCRGKV